MSAFQLDNASPDRERIERSSAGSPDSAKQALAAAGGVEKGTRAPAPSSEASRHRMRATRQRGTKPEMAFRSALDQLDVHYGIDQSPVPGLKSRPDLILEDVHIAVYIDGCFWHSCPAHGTLPKANGEWWRQKLEANRQRDARANDALTAAGWHVVRIWEHEDPIVAAKDLRDLVEQRRTRQPEPQG